MDAEKRRELAEWVAARDWSVFGTLTFRDFVHREQAHKRFERWIRRLEHYEGHLVAWARSSELQDRGVLHYHLLASGTRAESLGRYAHAWTEIGGGHAKLAVYDPSRGGAYYLVKEYPNRGEFDVSESGPFPPERAQVANAACEQEAAAQADAAAKLDNGSLGASGKRGGGKNQTRGRGLRFAQPAKPVAAGFAQTTEPSNPSRKPGRRSSQTGGDNVADRQRYASVKRAESLERANAVSLDELAADCTVAEALSPAEIIELYARVAAVETRLFALMLATRQRLPGEETQMDKIVRVPEAAKMLGTSEDTLYEKWRKLPFAFKDPLDGKIKFSQRGIQQYIGRRIPMKPS